MEYKMYNNQQKLKYYDEVPHYRTLRWCRSNGKNKIKHQKYRMMPSKSVQATIHLASATLKEYDNVSSAVLQIPMFIRLVMNVTEMICFG